MRAAYLESAGLLTVKQVEDPGYGSDEALVKVYATGICGSDLHYFKDGKLGTNVITDPLVLGHECSGEVVAVGSDVHHLQPGDKVTLEPGVPCGACELCLAGDYNLCGDVKFLGAPPTHGSFREYINHKALFTHKLPDTVSFEEGACIEPLAVAFHAVQRAVVRPGERVLITGAGPVGLMCMLLSRIAGAAEVAITDIDSYRLGVAEKLGADLAIDVRTADVPENSFDCVVEATGNVEVIAAAVASLRKRGRILVIGMSNSEAHINLTALMRKEADIVTVYRYANCFQPVIRLIASGMIDVSPLVTHRYSLEDISAAFDFADDATQSKIKIVVG